MPDPPRRIRTTTLLLFPDSISRHMVSHILSSNRIPRPALLSPHQETKHSGDQSSSKYEPDAQNCNQTETTIIFPAGCC
jgi:hypothetical protein